MDGFHEHWRDRGRHLKRLIVGHLGVDEEVVTPEASLVKDLGADSLDTAFLVMALEDEFCIEIPDEETDTISAVKEVIDCIVRALSPPT